MNRFLLLMFLSSWSTVVPLSLQCETGVAYPGHVLSIPHSLMANADVALLQTYQAEDVNVCMTDCCTEKFGSCTVVSFKKNVSENSCQHFNCRPVTKCRYLSSNSTDSFSFSSSPSPAVPSRNSSTTSSVSRTHQDASKAADHGITKEVIATYSEEQPAMKDDNTTIKPRKGVHLGVTRTGIKPRKGVTLDDAVSNDTKSNVKPRKGVGAFVSTTASSLQELPLHSPDISTGEHAISSTSFETYKNVIASDLVSALEKVFEDDPAAKTIKSTPTCPTSDARSIDSAPTASSVYHSSPVLFQSRSSAESEHPSAGLESSYSTVLYHRPSTVTPRLTADSAGVVHDAFKPSASPSIYEHSKLIFHEVPAEDSADYADSEESEKERKYKSSMHLVLSLVFGLLVLFVVFGVVAKRIYDGWIRRHYRRMDFLIDGMYNGYG